MTILRCSCCNVPWARLENGVLIVEAKHHGERHVNVVPVGDLANPFPESTPYGIMAVSQPTAWCDDQKMMIVG